MRFQVEAARPAGISQITLLPRVLMTLLALAFVLSGLGLFAYHVAIVRTWLPIEATVVRSEVIGFRSKKQQSMYRGEVELAYTVSGREYRTPEAFSTATSSGDSLREKMETIYGAGTKHVVFYDPTNPYALRWNVGYNFTFFLLPIAFTGVGLILLGVCYLLCRQPLPVRPSCNQCGAEGVVGDRYCAACGASLEAKRKPISSDDESADEDLPEPGPSQRENPTALKLVGAFFGLPGLACCVGAIYMGIENYYATQVWPVREAVVTKSGIETGRSTDGTPSYQLAVAFHVEGEPEPDRAAGKSIYASASYPWIVQRLIRYSVGSRHTIRVNPSDAADVRFDLESSFLNWMPTGGLALFGLIFGSIGVALLWWGFKPHCAHCRHCLSAGAQYCSDCGQTVVAKLSASSG